jgi:hypothetical protein|tara:strand:- start:297 stop:539 length:243 start_codon:yes stop_codon:yes gene_type:complete
LLNDDCFVDINIASPVKAANDSSAAYGDYKESKPVLLSAHNFGHYFPHHFAYNFTYNNANLTGVKIKLEFYLRSRYFIHS